MTIKETHFVIPWLMSIALASCALQYANAADGTSSLCFTDNNGRYSIIGSKGERFVTGWSECSADSVYAYKDYVRLVGVSDTLTDFPETSSSFVDLDWEQRAPTIQEGQFVVFLNDQGQFLCVKVIDVKVKSRGDSEDKLTIEYRVYGTDVTSAQLINDTHAARLKDYEVSGQTEGSANFCFANNSGCFTVIGPCSELFVTGWSECGADSVYAIGDYVKLVGVSDTLTDFPETSASFVGLDWEQRAPTIQEGQFVVFLNDQGQFLCVKVIDVKVKSRGDSKDLLVFQYKVYEENSEVATAILTSHENRMNEYEEVGGDEGTVSFCFANNSGRFTVVGADGARFVTAWSECGSDTIYAYKDYVKVIGVSDTLADFPETSAAFVGLAWDQRARTIKVGSFVVFMNNEGRFLCAHVKKIGAKSRGAVENIVVFDYKIYGYEQQTSDIVLDLANKINWGFAIVKVDVSANGIVKIPYDGDDWKTKVRLIKRVRTGGIEREVDLTNLLTVPWAGKGELDMSRAEVNSEIVAEVFDSKKGAIVDFSSRIPKIKTANTHEGLTYEFYDVESLDALKTASPQEVMVGDGLPFIPNISTKTGTSRFFRVKVSK